MPKQSGYVPRSLDALSLSAGAEEPSDVEPLAIEDVSGETLRDILLAGIADIRGRQLAGVRMGDRDTTMLSSLLDMLQEFPKAAAAIDAARGYQPEGDVARSGAAVTTPEALRRLRAVMGSKK